MAINAKTYESNASSDNAPFNVALDSADIEAGDAVKLTGPMEVEPVDTAGEEYLGLAVNDATAGEKLAVYLWGAHPANVANPDGSVSPDQRLIPSGNSGELRPINTGGATGESPPATGEKRTLTNEDSEGYSLLLLR